METTIVFVPGAWSGPEGWQEVAKILEGHGFSTDFVHLASVGPKEPLQNLDPDIDVIRKHVKQAVDGGHRVVLVMHSYGSVPGSAAVEGLDYKSRQADGLAGGIVLLVNVCGMLVPPGMSMYEACGGQDAPFWKVSPDRMSVEVMNPEQTWFCDLPEDIAKAHAAALKTQSLQPKMSKVKYAGWQTIPTTYVYTTEDKLLPTFLQKMLVENFGSGFNIRTDELATSHAPYLSKPEETAAVIQRAIDSVS